MKKAPLVILFAVVLSLVSLLCVAGCSSGSSAKGQDFGSFETQDFEGNTVTQDVFKDHKLTAVNVWQTTCTYCVEEMPALDAMNEKYADQGVQIISVCQDTYDYENNKVNDDLLAEAKDIVNQTGFKCTCLVNNGTVFPDQLSNLNSFPVTYFVDENGKVVDVMANATDEDGWDQKIQEELDNLS